MTMSLRARLLIALSALLFIGVVLSDASSVAALHAYLLNQIDVRLSEATSPVLHRLDPARQGQVSTTAAPIPPPQNQRGDGGYFGVSDFFIEFRLPDGNVETRVSPLLRNAHDPAPNITNTVVQAHADKGPFNLAAVGRKSFDYRATVATAPDKSVTVTVALPLQSTKSTIGRLITIEIVATVVLLLILLTIGWFVIRADLRPLEDMADTAGAIAAGDLTQRVKRADSQTEVGRLGGALNSMLSQIETSFAERKASEDRLRRFAADASHELRTPLTAIRGYAEMYRSGAVTGQDHLDRAMGRIEGEAIRMGQMVNDLLLLARLDQRRQLNSQDVNLVGILHDVVADARAGSPDRSIDLDIPDSPGGVVIKADGSQMHQVFANLVSNALIHTPSETLLRVSLRDQDGYAVVDVSDNGPGLHPDVLDKVFERFYRVDAGRSRQLGGTGLGLAIVSALVEAHGGTVGVTSSPGQGATFSVRLPLLTAISQLQ